MLWCWIGLGCVQRTMLCKAFPCREGMCDLRGPGLPLAWLGTPFSASALVWRRRPLVTLVWRDSWIGSRASGGSM